ncbi:MAG: RnfABCDGE type electron transport complex subunit G [Muriicola sp.]|nr:RnfABCDGE type electron transport complex subunit G [Muriicola sp.]NNK11864.1 RnfABCDGE type electron transport complex subunit G [Flavobacteriaceae bacterium]
MKKKESTLLNMVSVLLIITLVAGLSLGYVNDLTLEPKARARLARVMNALDIVLPQFNNEPVSSKVQIKVKGVKDSTSIYPAYRDSIFVGAAVTGISEKGYSGVVKLMVGFEPDGQIKDIVVLEQKETPGLGTKMKGEKFLSQFRNQDPANILLKVKKDGGDVDALSGATISSRAFAEATQQAFDVFTSYEKTEIDYDQ